MAEDKTQFSKPGGGRRRVPRRKFNGAVGILLHGQYVVDRGYQVGEGGMMISSARPLKEGEQLVTSFFLTSLSPIMVRGVVRTVNPPKDGLPVRYGIEFLNLGFQHKREIRNFVAASTRSDGFISS